MTAVAITDRARTAIELGESHFREFKSALEGKPGKKTPRSIASIANNVAETLVAFANADGGELLVGVEDSGEITGINHCSEKQIAILEESPKNKIHKETPLPQVKKHRIELDGKVVLYFSVPKSTRYVHVTADGRCLQRKDLESVPVASEAIRFDRKEEKSREYDRHFIDGVSADELNIEAVSLVSEQILKGMSPEKCLQYLELAEYGLSQLRLRRAALLLFAKEPTKWHPRLQIRLVRVDGTEVKTGEDYNVVSDETISGNILTLVESAWEALRPHLVHTTIDKDARFEQRSIYPELACREALLNAIAHRDYSEEGRGIEVFIFEDRLEISNPGALLASISEQDLKERKGVHQSRNTHIARVLREVGYMRELGEGMRRIYELMHRNELSDPVISSTQEGFRIALNHRPMYSEKELLWLEQYEGYNLDREQKAIVLLGNEGRVFSPKDIWDAVGIVDTEHYRKLVDGLMKLGILSNKLGDRAARNKARTVAKKKNMPFREYPRYVVAKPSQKSAVTRNKKYAVDKSELRDEPLRLYIGNLPPNTKKNDLFSALSGFGDIAELYLPQREGKNRGYCFVEFESNKTANKVMNGTVEIGGYKLVVRKATPK